MLLLASVSSVNENGPRDKMSNVRAAEGICVPSEEGTVEPPQAEQVTANQLLLALAQLPPNRPQRLEASPRARCASCVGPTERPANLIVALLGDRELVHIGQLSSKDHQERFPRIDQSHAAAQCGWIPYFVPSPAIGGLTHDKTLNLEAVRRRQDAEKNSGLN